MKPRVPPRLDQILEAATSVPLTGPEVFELRHYIERLHYRALLAEEKIRELTNEVVAVRRQLADLQHPPETEQ